MVKKQQPTIKLHPDRIKRLRKQKLLDRETDDQVMDRILKYYEENFQ